MIPLMSCSPRDLQSYYSGCTVFDADHQPFTVADCSSTSVILVDQNSNAVSKNKKELFVHYFEPFYDASGEMHGLNVSRSYKRAPSYEQRVFPELRALLKGEFKSTFDGATGRIGKRFYANRDLRLGSVLSYNTELCGFYREGTFFVPDMFLAERLRDQINSEGLSYVVQTV